MNEFPIPKIEAIPTRITPCPIVEAILEIRFVTTKSWRLLPGLLYNQIQDHYGEPTDLPLAEMPEEFRQEHPEFRFRPLTNFDSERFSIRLGPRVFSLMSRGEYPGWSEISTEMEWLLGKLQEAAFVGEGERLGMRYIDFFEDDLFPHLVLQPQCAGEPLAGIETTLTTAFAREDFNARLILNNSVVVETENGPQYGSAFDLDLSLSAANFELFENGLQRFHEANRVNKEIFFGLLQPDFLSTLSPEYR